MWSNKDILWLRKNYPSLKQISKTTIQGRLPFQMLHADGKNYVNPTSQDVSNLSKNGNYICDTYNIKIVLTDRKQFPIVQELGTRITSVADRYNISLGDVHLFQNKTFCLASWQEYFDTFDKGFNLETFINEYIIPFLFAQSYFARTKIWPWGQLSHLHWGLLEWLGRREKSEKHHILRTAMYVVYLAGIEEAKKLFSLRSRSHHPCPCNSGKKTKKCHPDIKSGINTIRGELSRHYFSLEDFSK